MALLVVLESGVLALQGVNANDLVDECDEKAVNAFADVQWQIC